MRGGTIVLFQPDHLSAGEILLEAQDVADLGAAPAIDRLVVVTHAGDVAPLLREQAASEIVAVFHDDGRAYLDTVYNDEWVSETFHKEA